MSWAFLQKNIFVISLIKSYHYELSSSWYNLKKIWRLDRIKSWTTIFWKNVLARQDGTKAYHLCISLIIEGGFYILSIISMWDLKKIEPKMSKNGLISQHIQLLQGFLSSIEVKKQRQNFIIFAGFSHQRRRAHCQLTAICFHQEKSL